ncbi:hypothetical protein BC361_00190 [Ensifer sp. LC54]|nr:hypothetical protein BC363_06710 [Ensifer sp. LC384]OCP28088.1 hypothetical protein BC361_00190 [Ensifer sp. LC54]
MAATASNRYKVYEIPKRSGGKRTIEHPSKELKAIQRWIAKAVFARFPIHSGATAYRQGFGIRENAERHRQSKFTNRYDFSNFFPSFTQAEVQNFLRSRSAAVGLVLTEKDIGFVGNIVCRNGRLTIGSPTSPIITNTMMFDFDVTLDNFCAERGLIFTRYADDMFVSSNKEGQLFSVEDGIHLAMNSIPNLNLEVNHKKTALLSKKYLRRVTGVVITSDHRLSIGRHRKREIKALIHKWRTGTLEVEKLHYMRGLVAFARDVEPNFEQRLRLKYGDQAIDEIVHSSDLSIVFDKNT